MGQVNSKLLNAIATFSIVLGAASAFAGGEGRFFERLTREANLTAEQKEQIKKIHTQSMEEMKGKRDAMKQAHEALEEALRGTAPDAEVKAKFAKLQAVQDEFAQARFEKVLSVRAILTPEQRKSIKSAFGGMDHHRGFGHGRFKDRHKNDANNEGKSEE